MNEEIKLRSETVTFDVAPDVLQKGVRVVVFTISGLENRETDPEFDDLLAESTRNILAELKETPLPEDKVIQGFRNIHTHIGFSNRNFPPASENLLEYVIKNRTLPRINLLVDIYNLVSVETRLALGAHDLAYVSGNVHLRTTTGTEGYLPLGSPVPKPVRPGGYAYIDDDNDVICLLEVKQVEKTKATLNTRECLFIVQGNAATEYAYIQAAAGRLVDLIKHFCGGQEHYLYRGLVK
jgi:DNA/RNA-binding domain of Phe-tRNA-synthetase-like protein